MKNVALCILLGTALLSSCETSKTDDDMIPSSPIEVDTKTVSFYGGFTGGPGHAASGTASINKELTELKFTNLKVDNGPQLEIWLATSKTPTAPGSNYISLGEIKGISGDYAYSLPEQTIDYSKYKYVLIWCLEFKSLFGDVKLEKGGATPPIGEETPSDNNTTFQGSFAGSNAHPTTSGVASINKESTVLSFTNFKCDNGPLLEVWLATSKTPGSDYRSLGALKGVSGDYTYDLPSEDLDYTKYKYVVIWCVQFTVSFGEAELGSQTVNNRLE